MRVNQANDTLMQNTEYDFKRLIPAAIAVAGVAVVELHGAAGAPTTGDLISFAQPIGFGLGYLILEELMAKRPDTALAVSAIKLAVVAIASFAMFELTPLIQNGVDNWSFAIPDFSPIFASKVALGGVFYTGLVTTALALWVESKAFAHVPATDASLILTTEPLFAAALAAITLGETFGLSDYAGASLIIGACIMATLLENQSRDEECLVEVEDCEMPRSTVARF
jgi:drug/metabolite transporter (DMT)-like permease